MKIYNCKYSREEIARDRYWQKQCSFGVPSIVARYPSAICSLFVRYLFGPEPDKYRTSNAHVPDKNDGKSLPAFWVLLIYSLCLFTSLVKGNRGGAFVLSSYLCDVKDTKRRYGRLCNKEKYPSSTANQGLPQQTEQESRGVKERDSAAICLS